MLATWVGIGFIVAVIHVWADTETSDLKMREMSREKFCKYLLGKIAIALLWPIGLYLLFFNSGDRRK